MGLDGKGGERRDGVDAARAEENETGAVVFAVFEEVDRAAEVVFDELARAGFAVDAGQDARVGGGVDNPVHGWQGLEIARGAEIGVNNFDPEFFEAYESAFVEMYNQKNGKSLQLSSKRKLSLVEQFLFR